MTTAKIILDSINPDGKRIVTFELSYPKNIHWELLTHRCFCLDGDAELEFDLPSGTSRGYDKRIHTMTIREFVLKWINGDSRGRSMQGRLKSMRLRQLNEDTLKIQHCNVSNAWVSGSKEVFEVKAGGFTVGGSKDHRILTVDGWKTIGELVVGKDFIITEKLGSPDKVDPIRLKKFGDKWKSTYLNQIRESKLADQESMCYDCGADISNYSEGHHVIPVNADESRTFDYDNIILLCKDCHKDRHKIQGWQGGNHLYGLPMLVESVTSIGFKETYDIEVNSNYHNFIANGIVVHNSRNASSTRAIPVETMVKSAVEEFDYPPFMLNQKGMQADIPATGETLDAAKFIWAKAFESAVLAATTLGHLGIHKQNANRLLYPFTNIAVVLTATEFENFFNLRLAPDAQQEIQELARLMKEAMDNSTPNQLGYYDWHIPYLTKEELGYSLADKLITSVARTARVSYEHQGEHSYLANDGVLTHRLLTSGHFSPFEHQAMAEELEFVVPSNLVGFTQLRHVTQEIFTDRVWEQYNL